jgi:predicted glycoside hydrolase/deacetylase ChbG (UPF0249 family)
MQLIINADDLGYSPHRDAAIFELFRMGKITSASLIVNGPTAATASERARLVGLPIGLHLNLTEGEPLTSGLVKADGKLAYKMEFRRLAHCAPKDFIEAVDEEVAAQLERFKALTGAYPTHVDGHQHVHILPNMPTLMAPVFKLYGVQSIRIPEEDVDDYEWVSAERKKHYNIRYLDAVAARMVYMKHGFKLNDSFVGFALSGANMTAKRLEQCLGQASGLTEMLVHPGFLPENENVTAFCDTFDEDPGRQTEFDCLSNFAFRQKVVSWSVF